jgi:hypothetical protein
MTEMIAVAIVDLKAGPALDWAVAKAEGIETDLFRKHEGRVVPRFLHGLFWVDFEPSTNWNHGSEILRNLECASWHILDGKHTFKFSVDDECAIGVGTTMLEAAMLAIVKAKFGDAVKVPRALWSGK